LLVHYVAPDGANVTGFTWDLSYTGIFIATHHLPKMGEQLTIVLELPKEKKVSLTGTAVRARRVPTALSYTEPSGFSLMLTGYSEPYTQFIATLQH